MKYHDAIGKLIDLSSGDEATKLAMHAAVEDHNADAIAALSDAEKEQRRAPVDILAGSVPAIFVGGITQDQLDRIVAQAIANYENGKAAVPAAPKGKATVPAAPKKGKAAASAVPAKPDSTE